MSSLTRKILNSLFPEGAAWTPKAGGDFDKYLDGQAENIDGIVSILSDLSTIRDPLKTKLLDDLEREYGIAKNASLTDIQRRQFLQAFIFGSQENGTDEELQRRLRDAGFDVFVYPNDPAQDPLVILDQAFRMVAGGQNAFAGRVDAFARRQGGELIVNQDQFKEVPDFKVTAGGTVSFAGNIAAFAGSFSGTVAEKIDYVVPANPKDWPLLFFVGGDAEFDIDGRITSLETVLQPKELRNEFLKIILKYKPLHTWCISVVDFV